MSQICDNGPLRVMKVMSFFSFPCEWDHQAMVGTTNLESSSFSSLSNQLNAEPVFVVLRYKRIMPMHRLIHGK